MAKRKTQRGTERTNKDAANRGRPKPYRLTAAGLTSLRSSVLANRPWRRSTGPRTTAGKARSRMNAWKHGDRGADAIAARREVADTLRKMRDAEDSARLWRASAESPSDQWADRILADLRDLGG